MMSEINPERDEKEQVDMMCKEIYSNLRLAMYDKQNTVSNISDCLTIDNSYIYGFYSGKKNPGLKTIIKICLALDIPFESIFPGSIMCEGDIKKIQKFMELTKDCTDEEIVCIFEIINAYNNNKKK